MVVSTYKDFFIQREKKCKTIKSARRSASVFLKQKIETSFFLLTTTTGIYKVWVSESLRHYRERKADIFLHERTFLFTKLSPRSPRSVLWRSFLNPLKISELFPFIWRFYGIVQMKNLKVFGGKHTIEK